MFNKFIAKLKRLSRSQEKVDPALFEDPVAEQTEWTPLKSGGANFCTHKLAAEYPNRVVFRASVGAVLFYLVFLLAGLGMLIGFPLNGLLKGTFEFSLEMLIPGVVGTVFTLVGGIMFYYGTQPIVFDNQSGYFWKGRKNPGEVYRSEAIKCWADLEDVHALQLISEYCRGDKSSYYSYELNLVMQDGRRINVVDHGKQDRIRADAETLGEFLGKPVWDAILNRRV
ncbi:MAG: hypothetical protein JXD22_02480 [Sedimentisphaerales bacterium]|nr:hypothetical protein [Sedimentisphaerales bacterium]